MLQQGDLDENLLADQYSDQGDDEVILEGAMVAPLVIEVPGEPWPQALVKEITKNTLNIATIGLGLFMMFESLVKASQGEAYFDNESKAETHGKNDLGKSGSALVDYERLVAQASLFLEMAGSPTTVVYWGARVTLMAMAADSVRIGLPLLICAYYGDIDLKRAWTSQRRTLKESDGFKFIGPWMIEPKVPSAFCQKIYGRENVVRVDEQNVSAPVSDSSWVKSYITSYVVLAVFVAAVQNTAAQLLTSVHYAKYRNDNWNDMTAPANGNLCGDENMPTYNTAQDACYYNAEQNAIAQTTEDHEQAYTLEVVLSLWLGLFVAVPAVFELSYYLMKRNETEITRSAFFNGIVWPIVSRLPIYIMGAFMVQRYVSGSFALSLFLDQFNADFKEFRDYAYLARPDGGLGKIWSEAVDYGYQKALVGVLAAMMTRTFWSGVTSCVILGAGLVDMIACASFFNTIFTQGYALVTGYSDEKAKLTYLIQNHDAVPAIIERKEPIFFGDFPNKIALDDRDVAPAVVNDEEAQVAPVVLLYQQPSYQFLMRRYANLLSVEDFKNPLTIASIVIVIAVILNMAISPEFLQDKFFPAYNDKYDSLSVKGDSSTDLDWTLYAVQQGAAEAMLKFMDLAPTLGNTFFYFVIAVFAAAILATLARRVWNNRAELCNSIHEAVTAACAMATNGMNDCRTAVAATFDPQNWQFYGNRAGYAALPGAGHDNHDADRAAVNNPLVPNGI